jgi:hypothetical protein
VGGWFCTLDEEGDPLDILSSIQGITAPLHGPWIIIVFFYPIQSAISSAILPIYHVLLNRSNFETSICSWLWPKKLRRPVGSEGDLFCAQRITVQSRVPWFCRFHKAAMLFTGLLSAPRSLEPPLTARTHDPPHLWPRTISHQGFDIKDPHQHSITAIFHILTSVRHTTTCTSCPGYYSFTVFLALYYSIVIVLASLLFHGTRTVSM